MQNALLSCFAVRCEATEPEFARRPSCHLLAGTCATAGGVDATDCGICVLRCAPGDCTSVRTINERLSKCSLTQSSITEVFAGGEHQGEYLDKTITQFRDKEVLVRILAVDSWLDFVRRSAEHRSAHLASRGKFATTSLGVFVEVTETSEEIRHHGGCPLQGQAEDHRQPKVVLPSGSDVACAAAVVMWVLSFTVAYITLHKIHTHMQTQSLIEAVPRRRFREGRWKASWIATCFIWATSLRRRECTCPFAQSGIEAFGSDRGEVCLGVALIENVHQIHMQRSSFTKRETD